MRRHFLLLGCRIASQSAILRLCTSRSCPGGGLDGGGGVVTAAGGGLDGGGGIVPAAVLCTSGSCPGRGLHGGGGIVPAAGGGLDGGGDIVPAEGGGLDGGSGIVPAAVRDSLQTVWLQLIQELQHSLREAPRKSHTIDLALSTAASKVHLVAVPSLIEVLKIDSHRSPSREPMSIPQP